MQHIRRMQHLCGIYCERVRGRQRERGRAQQHVAHLKRTKYLCCKLLHTLWHIGALCRAANGNCTPDRGEHGAATGRDSVGVAPLSDAQTKHCANVGFGLIAICLNVCYTIFQRLTLCNPSPSLRVSPSPSLPLCCLLLLRCAFLLSLFNDFQFVRVNFASQLYQESWTPLLAYLTAKCIASLARSLSLTHSIYYAVSVMWH